MPQENTQQRRHHETRWLTGINLLCWGWFRMKLVSRSSPGSSSMPFKDIICNLLHELHCCGSRFSSITVFPWANGIPSVSWCANLLSRIGGEQSWQPWQPCQSRWWKWLLGASIVGTILFRASLWRGKRLKQGEKAPFSLSLSTQNDIFKWQKWMGTIIFTYPKSGVKRRPSSPPRKCKMQELFEG